MPYAIQDMLSVEHRWRLCERLQTEYNTTLEIRIQITSSYRIEEGLPRQANAFEEVQVTLFTAQKALSVICQCMGRVSEFSIVRH